MTSEETAGQPLIVVALGGNALDAADDAPGFAGERHRIERSARHLQEIAAAGNRLLIVHGNGPQVGRLLAHLPHAPGQLDLDVHVAHTQGELGYLVAAALGRLPVVAIVTRVRVASPLGAAVKPIGPVLRTAPPGVDCAPVDGGWRRVVASPKPLSIDETQAIRALLATHHVIAGGGGGVPLDASGTPVDCVVDKDWVASRLAMDLDATALVFVTNVAGLYDGFESGGGVLVPALDVASARARLPRLPRGSMGPKVEAAAEYVEHTGRAAVICALDQLADGWRGSTGTRISPD